MAIYAHRGASIEFPENTLAAFQRAVDLGTAGVELDVHLSRDGVPVVIHDESVDRTTNGSGKIADLTLAEIQVLDAGRGEKVPTLAEVFDIVAGKLKVDIEVKAAPAAAAVLLEVARYPTLDWLISSFYWDALRYVREQSATAELWVLWPSATDEAIAVGREIGATVLNLEYSTVTEEQVKRVAADGLRIGVWTVNDLTEAKWLRDIGVVAICTDDPARLNEVFADR
ncbi:MAG: glycerophosphodiester phosphodiesterase family protein [Thermomicrobiales bacterium]